MIGKHVNNYDSKVVAELYDMEENYTCDIDFIRKLIADEGKLNILECFAGTGRILIPLAEAGHRLTGIELSASMLERAKQKMEKLDRETKNRINLINDDILQADWGTDYDLVIIGCNAFYELPSPEIQEACIAKAHTALKCGGHIFVDNDDYKGNWGQISFGIENTVFEGTVSDGTFGRMTRKDDKFDEELNILDFTHKLYVRTPEGKEETFVYKRSKHPVTASELRGMLERQGFHLIDSFGDVEGNPYEKDSKRGIFWAAKD